MITKLIIFTIVYGEQNNVDKRITTLLVCLELLLTLFLIPIIMIAACLRAMFIKC